MQRLLLFSLSRESTIAVLQRMQKKINSQQQQLQQLLETERRQLQQEQQQQLMLHIHREKLSFLNARLQQVLQDLQVCQMLHLLDDGKPSKMDLCGGAAAVRKEEEREVEEEEDGGGLLNEQSIQQKKKTPSDLKAVLRESIERLAKRLEERERLSLSVACLRGVESSVCCLQAEEEVLLLSSSTDGQDAEMLAVEERLFALEAEVEASLRELPALEALQQHLLKQAVSSIPSSSHLSLTVPQQQQQQQGDLEWTSGPPRERQRREGSSDWKLLPDSSHLTSSRSSRQRGKASCMQLSDPEGGKGGLLLQDEEEEELVRQAGSGEVLSGSAAHNAVHNANAKKQRNNTSFFGNSNRPSRIKSADCVRLTKATENKSFRSDSRRGGDLTENEEMKIEEKTKKPGSSSNCILECIAAGSVGNQKNGDDSSWRRLHFGTEEGREANGWKSEIKGNEVHAEEDQRELMSKLEYKDRQTEEGNRVISDCLNLLAEKGAKENEDKERLLQKCGNSRFIKVKASSSGGDQEAEAAVHTPEMCNLWKHSDSMENTNDSSFSRNPPLTKGFSLSPFRGFPCDHPAEGGHVRWTPPYSRLGEKSLLPEQPLAYLEGVGNWTAENGNACNLEDDQQKEEMFPSSALRQQQERRAEEIQETLFAANEAQRRSPESREQTEDVHHSTGGAHSRSQPVAISSCSWGLSCQRPWEGDAEFPVKQAHADGGLSHAFCMQEEGGAVAAGGCLGRAAEQDERDALTAAVEAYSEVIRRNSDTVDAAPTDKGQKMQKERNLELLHSVGSDDLCSSGSNSPLLLSVGSLHLAT
ncbi:hypothetical protein Efla_002389 [Eimeria flavescens]